MRTAVKKPGIFSPFVPFPSPGDLPNPGIEPKSPALQADSLPAEPPGKPIQRYQILKIILISFKKGMVST